MHTKEKPPVFPTGGTQNTLSAHKDEASTPQPPDPRKGKARERWRKVKGRRGVKVSDRGRVKGAEVRVHEGRRYACGRSVARLVFESYRERVPAGRELHHLDGDRANDSLANLVALTPSEHARADKREPRIRFEPWTIAEVFARHRRGESADAIFERTGVSWRHQRHLFRNRDRRAALVHFLDTGEHLFGQLDLFGRGGDA